MPSSQIIPRINSFRLSTKTPKAKSLDLSLDYRSDAPLGGPQWLKQAYTTYSYSETSPTDRLQTPSKLSDRDRDIMNNKRKGIKTAPEKPWKNPDKGTTSKSASPSFGFKVSYEYPALLDPQKFLRDLLIGDTVTTSSTGIDLSLGLDLSVRQQFFPIFAAIFGVEMAVQWAVNWNSSFSQGDIIAINEIITGIRATPGLSPKQQQDKIDKILSDMLTRTYTDLSKEKFSTSITPYVAGELGIPLLNLLIKLGITPKVTVSKERWIDGGIAANQLVNLKDYWANPQTKRYGYAPKLESLTFHLEHMYDFCWLKGPRIQLAIKALKMPIPVMHGFLISTLSRLI